MSSLSSKVKNLLIPRKTQDPIDQPGYGTDSRAIENWAQQVGKFAGTIQEIVAGANITVTDGDGPVVTITSTATVGGYASLTGPGQSTSPGDLTQAGGFTVNAAADPIDLNTSSGIINLNTSAGAVELNAASGAGVAVGTASVSAGVNAVTTTWIAHNITTTGPASTSGNTVKEIFYLPSTGTSRWLVGADGTAHPVITVDAFGALTPELGFFNAAPMGQPAAITKPTGGATIDTQARIAIDAIIDLLSAAASGYGLTA